MNIYPDMPEIYNKQCQAPLKFWGANVYYIDPIKIPVSFFDASGGPFDIVPIDCWLELIDSEGNIGQAPCTRLMEKKLLPLIMSGETHTYEEWYRRMYWAIRNDGFSGETANELGRLDLALHDLMSKRVHLSLHRFLGATRDWAAVYASCCGTEQENEGTARQLEQYVREGYTCFKIKVGKNFGENEAADLDKIRIARETIGRNGRLAVDVNQIFHAGQALRFAEKFQKYDIAWFEEPVHSHNFKELRNLTKVCPVPVAMGESVKNAYMLEAYVDCGVGQLQPIPTNLSGVRDWLCGRVLAYENGIQFTSGGISQLTSAFIASGREEDMVEYLTPIMTPLNEFLKKHPEEKNGRFILEDNPGSPIVPDLDLLRKTGYLTSVSYIKAKGKKG